MPLHSVCRMLVVPAGVAVAVALALHLVIMPGEEIEAA